METNPNPPITAVNEHVVFTVTINNHLYARFASGCEYFKAKPDEVVLAAILGTTQAFEKQILDESTNRAARRREDKRNPGR